MTSPTSRRLDLFNGLARAHCLQDVVDVASKVVRPLGFDYCGWRARLPRPVAHQRFMTLHNVEDAVFEQEVAGHYSDDVPILRHCSRSMSPLSWTGETEGTLFEQSPDLWEEFFAMGHRGGWAQSLIEGDQHYCMFWAHSKHCLPSSSLAHADKELEWVAAAVTACTQSLKANTTPALTLREKSILHWVGEALDCDAMAARMQLSSSTVRFHLENAMYKLNAPRPNIAVTQALFMGYIH